MTRQRSPRVVQRDEALLPRIQQLKADHPFWGYRRIWAYLRYVEHYKAFCLIAIILWCVHLILK